MENDGNCKDFCVTQKQQQEYISSPKCGSFKLDNVMARENIRLFKNQSQNFLNPIRSALRDLVAFVQLKNRKKHPWRSVNFNKVAG